MESTTQTPRPGTARSRGSARAGGAAARDTEYDLLTAALIGVAIGVGTTLLLRSGPAAVRSAGRHLNPSRGERARRLVARQVSGYADAASGYADAARERVDEIAAGELRALRRAIRRRRKQLGI